MDTDIALQYKNTPFSNKYYYFYSDDNTFNIMIICLLCSINVIYLYMFHQHRNKILSEYLFDISNLGNKILSKYLLDISNLDKLSKNIEVLISKIEKIDNNKHCIMAKVGNTVFKFDEQVGSPSNFERRKILFSQSKPYHTFLAYVKAVCSYRLVEDHNFKLMDTYNLIYNHIKEIKLIPDTEITNDDILAIDLDDVMNTIKSSSEFEDEFRNAIIT